jgi:predicted carbohydrate-binding protein with CBM5 and CBM33 domain
LSTDITLSPGSQSITFTVTSNRTTKEYTIYISRHL